MGSVISCSELIINQECCTSAFSPLLPHGKSPSKNKEVISAEDPLSLPDSSCLPATANKPSELKLLWEPSTTKTQSSESEEVFTCHPQYSTFPATDYDYSIVTLESNVDLNDVDISAIAIANKEYPAGTIAQITGWGKTHGNINQIPTQLQVAYTPLMSQDDCAAIWGNLRITDRMQCVGGTGENSGCQGDSGGPLAYQDPADGVWYLIGNTSWGSSNCQVSMPAIWSKNVIVYDWIKTTAGL